MGKLASFTNPSIGSARVDPTCPPASLRLANPNRYASLGRARMDGLVNMAGKLSAAWAAALPRTAYSRRLQPEFARALHRGVYRPAGNLIPAAAVSCSSQITCSRRLARKWLFRERVAAANALKCRNQGS
jgi:hypothetical protein